MLDITPFSDRVPVQPPPSKHQRPLPVLFSQSPPRARIPQLTTGTPQTDSTLSAVRNLRLSLRRTASSAAGRTGLESGDIAIPQNSTISGTNKNVTIQPNPRHTQTHRHIQLGSTIQTVADGHAAVAVTVAAAWEPSAAGAAREMAAFDFQGLAGGRP